MDDDIPFGPQMKHKKYFTGGWIDETVPDLGSLLAPHGIDIAEFSAWLGRELGNYRLNDEYARSMPTRTEEIQYLENLKRRVRAVRTALGPAAVPPQVGAYLATHALRLEMNFHEIEKTVTEGLLMVEFLASQVASGLKKTSSKAGRKSTRPRDILLAEIIKKLRAAGTKAALAPKLANEILVMCKLPSAGSPESAEKAARRGKK